MFSSSSFPIRETRAIEDKGPAGLHHRNVAGVSFAVCVCVCVGLGLGLCHPYIRPLKKDRTIEIRPSIFASLTILQKPPSSSIILKHELNEFD